MGSAFVYLCREVQKITLMIFFFVTIAPNVYKIPTVLGSSKEGPIRSAPAYSITGKLKSKLPQCVQFPGPGSYDAKLDYMLKKPPVFSMASRYNIPSDTNSKPGPGAHRPEKVNLFFQTFEC